MLRVTSDIDGADVFVDRQYLGTTPFESSAVAPGRHKVNVSATGYESHAEDVEITNDVTTIVKGGAKLDHRGGGKLDH